MLLHIQTGEPHALHAYIDSQRIPFEQQIVFDLLLQLGRCVL